MSSFSSGMSSKTLAASRTSWSNSSVSATRPVALRADEHRAQAAEEHGARDRRGLALGEPGADHREGGPGLLAVRGQVVGAVEVERVDLAAGDEGLDAQGLVALRHRLGQLLFLDHDRFAAVGLVALCLVVALDRLAGLGIDEHAADAVAGLAIDDVEGDALGGRGGRVQRDRADELPDLEMAFPDRAGCHWRYLSAPGRNTTLMTPSSLSRNFLYISGASSSEAGCVTTKLGSISPASIFSSSGLV